LNGDGIFDKRDSDWGSTITIDYFDEKENSWKYYHSRFQQVFRFKGDHFEISDMALDGSYIKFGKTDLMVPELGKPVPSFTLKTMEGKTISSNDLKGKNVVLYFWATWCKICLDKLPKLQDLMKEYEKDGVEIILINVDEARRAELVNNIVKKCKLQWPLVFNGKGSSDPVWRIFGSIKGACLSTPLFIVKNSNNIVIYSDYGGKDYCELKDNLDSLKKEIIW
jgi:peroxiredoxin